MSVTHLVQAFTSLQQEEQQLFLDSIVPYIKEQASLESELSPEWKSEIDRHWKSIQDGTAKLISWQDLQDRINKKYGIHVDLP